MGPKKDKNANKGKKAQGESNEQIKLMKLEAERKKREEDAAKHEEEMRKMEEAYKKQLKLKKVHDEQIQETKDIWKKIEEKVETYKKDYRSAIWWEKYVKNITSQPNPLVSKEVYDYIAACEIKIQPLQQAIVQNNEALQLIYDIKYTENLHEDKTSSMKKTWKEQITMLENLIEENLKMSALHVLLDIPRYINITTGNLEYCSKVDHTSLCLWGNFSKNTKNRNFEFPEAGIKCELPKVIALMDCVFQLKHTDYDHFSSYCHTYVNKSKPKYEEPEVFAKKPIPVVEAEAGGGLNVASGVSPADIPATSVVKVQADGDNDGTMGRSEFHQKDPILQSGEIDLNEYIPLGGVWYINLLSYPRGQESNTSQGSKVLEEIPYEFPSFSGSGVVIAEESEKLISFHIQLPDFIVWNEITGRPSVANWNNSRKHWSSKDIYDVKFSEDKVISFRIAKFAPFTLLQYKHASLPYQSWIIRPIDKDVIGIIVHATYLQASFQIQKHQCSLLNLLSNGQRFMHHLCNKTMPPQMLLKEMQKHGVNFFPDHDSFKYLKPELLVKDWNTENSFYQNVALLCNAYEIASSRWTKTTTSRNTIIRIKEYLSPSVKGKERLVKFSLNQAVLLKASETCVEFCEEELPDQGFSADLYHLVLSLGSDEAKQQINQCSNATKEGVYEFLTCLKPLSYCQQ